MKPHYITTAIDYPNAAPHMGHVLEKVLADVIARYSRLQGRDVRFQIGLDEHGSKIAQTAEKEGMSPQELVDRNSEYFLSLYKRLNINYDDFLRTTNKERHWPTVIALWSKLVEAGKLEKRTYTGLYCSGCERFMTEKELEDGNCPDHKRPPEEISEENWFFTLSNDNEWLKEILTDGTFAIKPAFRAPEVLTLVEQGLHDVSFSREVTQLNWGVPVPNDNSQVMYVWCDALTNYISTLGLLTDNADTKFWDDATVTHVIGKDIARFHALIWPAMLKHAGVRTPDELLTHGFLTLNGQKMSKSLGNVLNPIEALDTYGVDPIRFYLCSEVPVGRDGDFTHERCKELYDAHLRNNLGNLLNRVLVMLNKLGGTLEILDNSPLKQPVTETWAEYHSAMENYDIHKALQSCVELMSAGNKHMNDEAPWKKTDDEKLIILSELAELLRHIALMLLPFIPAAAEEMLKQLSISTDYTTEWNTAESWNKVGEPSILFAPLEE